MKNQDQPIHPALIKQHDDSTFLLAKPKEIEADNYITSHVGLTKREYFAGLAMQAMIQSSNHATESTWSKILRFFGSNKWQVNYQYNSKQVAKCSVESADHLLKALES
jgi:predicted SpoU family rRNA methylase